MAPPRVTMDVGDDGVAVITIFNPPVNALAVSIIAGLKEKYSEAMRRSDVIAIVLTGEGGTFCGGFDIGAFGKAQKAGNSSALPNTSIDLTVNLIEDGRKPSVAAIQGLALGGGLEVAMACHARIAVPGTQLGLPELTLGIIPGMGGTQRLPRLIGLKKAIEMMLLSKSVQSEEGSKLGLIDALASPEELLRVSRQWALAIAQRQKPWIRTLHKTEKIGPLPEVNEILMEARKQAKQIARNMPQHQACIDAIQEGLVHGGYSGCLKEADISRDLVNSDASKGLVHMFFSQRLTSKVPGVTDVGLTPRRVNKVAVIGGGLMGSGIATSLILGNVYVLLKEINSEYLAKGIKVIEGNLKGLVSRGKLTPDKAKKALSYLKGVLDYNEFRDVDMVIEAVIENVSLKQSIFSDLEKVCPSHCILATNTSTINLNLVGERTHSLDRVVGAHFFSPAHIMPLLEIVRAEKTSPQVVLDLLTVSKVMKKVPVVVGNCTGFAVNRNFFPYGQSAQLLVHLGVDLFRVDKVIADFGFPIGPFMLQDLAGYGVAVNAGKELFDTYSERCFKSPLLPLLMKSGRNGKNNGRGYYLYEKGSKPKPDLSILPIIEESRRIGNIMPGGKPISVTDLEILEMVLFPVVNEACRVLDDGIVLRASDLDVSSVLGMSFPNYRGGIVFWADSVGPRYIYEKLKKWSNLYNPNFFKPCRYLEERAAKGIPLSAPASTSADSRSRL